MVDFLKDESALGLPLHVLPMCDEIAHGGHPGIRNARDESARRRGIEKTVVIYGDGRCSDLWLHAQNLPTLPALNGNATVVFQGDSITDGGRWREGSDYNHIMGQDYAYIIAAQFGAVYPERNVTFVNRGVGGDTVPLMAARWKADALDLKPSFLSILVGVNDTFYSSSGETAEEYEKGYDKLLADTLAALPAVKIVLGESFLLPVGKYKEDYPKKLAELKKRQDAVARLAGKYHLPLIHYQQIMTDACAKAPADHWSWDGVHPTYAGHGLMAEAWMRTVDAAWSKP